MRIRHLPETLINQIAAGEVIERPAAVIKELVENSLDAGATQIDIDIQDGGKSYMSVSDNGYGMSAEELVYCLDRHATSKLPDDDLLNIRHLGFRGEALPSIASVSRMLIKSKSRETGEAWSISAEGGKKGIPVPDNHPQGTKIEIRDLFFATPARLKFLKTDRSESTAIKDIVLRLAMAAPEVGLTLNLDGKKILNMPPSALAERLGRLLGRDFPENAMTIEALREDLQITGLASLPTYNKGNGLAQYLFVNGRAVRDRLLLGALKGAYSDVLARDRYPVVALFITLPAEDVDVNVHPAKAEVRFRDAVRIRGTLVSAIRHALQEQAGRSAGSTGTQTLVKLAASSPQPFAPHKEFIPTSASQLYSGMSALKIKELSESAQAFYQPLFTPTPSARSEPFPTIAVAEPSTTTHPLGAA
ncbi:MAG: DNA mismatch repair endonuclease MutL, partial [Rhodospirillales bacterium]|nr:DNA mismatch repair endonuclease MutL [Rhodospirillales bacterium]